MRDLRHLCHAVLLTAMILTIICPFTSSAASQTGGRSILSKGRWVKVHVDSTAVYRITRSQLREWGFDNPDNIIVAGYGSVERAHTLDSAPDDLPVLPVLRTSDAIYFYGEGDFRITLNSMPVSTSIAPFTAHYNYYSSGSYYFIGERAGMSSPDIATLAAGSAPATYTDTHYAIAHRQYRESHPTLHGMMSHSRPITASDPRSIDFDVEGNVGSAALYYSYIWAHDNTSSQSIGVSFSREAMSSDVSSESLSRNNSNEHTIFSYAQGGSLLNLAQGAGRFTATFSNRNGIFSSLGLVNTTVVYRRDNRITTPQQVLYFPDANEAIRFHDTTDGLTVWDVTDPRCPVGLDTKADGGMTVTARPQAGVTTVCAFTPSAAISSPEYAGAVTNQDVASVDGVDLLIVTTDATYDAAVRLAAAHEKWQGLKTAVLRQADVFNEYSSGALHPNGLRRLVKRLAASSARPLRYLMLFGHGSWDSRADFDTSGTEYMVMYNTEDPSEMGNTTKQYSSDLYFGTLTDRVSASLGSMRQNVAVSVGRVPALDATAAEAYVDKCITYLSDPFKAGSFNHAMISGGIGDSNAHFDAAENVGRLIRSAIECPTIHRSHHSLFPLSNVQLKHSANLDTYYDARFAGDLRFFNYTGHSSIDEISYYAHTTSRELSMKYGSLPVVYMSSCQTTPIDIPDLSLGTTMVLHNPGPIAVIGSGTEVYLNYNIRLNNRFVELFYSPDGGECLGDVFRTAVNSVKNNRDQYINNLCYNFLGDPALPRYIPERSVRVTSIGDNTGLTSESKVTVSPLTKVRISGVIADSNGNTDMSYSGKLMLNIYDAPHTQSTLKHDKSDAVTTLTIDEDIIYTSKIDVEDGRWSTYVTLPATSNTGANRMTLNAVSDSHIIASGGNRILTLAADSPSGPTAGTDRTAPAIRLWLDSPDMTDGAEVSSSPMLHIEITDDGSGVNLNSSAIGVAPKVMIDGTAISAAPYSLRPDGEGLVSGQYRLGPLADGHHSITVTARDLAGNSASQSIDFTVVHRDPTATLRASSALVRDDVNFTLTHSLPTGITTQHLVIRDIEGRTVLSTDTATFPYTWDFKDNDGATVPDGVYRASVSIKAHPYYTSTPETQFTIIKR